MKNLHYISIFLIILVTIFSGCEEEEQNHNNASSSSLASDVSSSSDKLQTSSISFSNSSTFSSTTSISSSSTSSTFIEVANQVFEYNDKNVTVFYGDSITFGSQSLERNTWYLSNRKNFPSNWFRYQFENNGTCSFYNENNFVKSCLYGINLENNDLYIQFDSGTIIVSYLNELENSFQIRELYLGSGLYVNYFTHFVDSLSDSLILDNNNSNNSEVSFTNYASEVIKLYKDENVTFGKLQLLGTWQLELPNAIDLIFTNSSSIEDHKLATGEGVYQLILHGINNQANEIYYSPEYLTNSEYKLISIKSIVDENCYMVDARDYIEMTSFQEEDYIVKMCKKEY